MWLKEPAGINETIRFLGTHELCFYLVQGKDALIIGGGMNHAAPALETQLHDIDIDSHRVKYLVVTHSHFDHCGAVPYLRRRFPDIEVLATAASRDTLAKQKVVDYNAKMNDLAAEQAGLGGECVPLEGQSDPFRIDRVVSEGDVVDLGKGVSAEFHAVPGHSKCCLATYVPGCRALFPTDTTPHPVNDWNDLAFPSAQYDFGSYVKSLRRLGEFDVEILGLDHHGVMLGAQAKEFLGLGLRRTLDFQQEVLRRYSVSKDLDEVARKTAREALGKVKLQFITEDLMFIITRAMIRNIVAGN
ncbi:MAG: MBL fold metallo-hydrolase [Chloroflexi bacterium]|nr:MBL fold metallo-hydrolase [Chloroflexota bacterium]